MLKILVIKPSSLGDIIHAAGAVRAISKGAGDAELSWVVNHEYADFVRELDGVHEVVAFPRGRFKLRRFPLWLPEAFRWFRSLRRFDIAIDLQGLQRSALMARLSGAEERFGPAEAREFGGFHYNHPIAYPADMPHAIDRLDHIARRVLEESRYLAPAPEAISMLGRRIEVPEHFLEKARRELDDDADWLAVCPGTRWESKHWPREHWSKLIEQLVAARPDWRFVLLGAPSERASLEAIRSHAGIGVERTLNLAGAVDLWTTAGILSLARHALTLDSAPLHLAAAVGTPTISLFGPTDPGRVAPRGSSHLVLRDETLECLACYERHCPLPERVCLPGISPEDVAANLLERIGGDSDR